MADIRLSVQIDAPAAQIYPLISSSAGFSKWWAADVTEQPDNIVDLGFFNRATIYSVRRIRAAAPAEAEWQCLSGNEWKGTRLVFQMTENKGQALLRFAHANWESLTDYFVLCSTTWGALMFRIKATAEGHTPGPLFSKSGWAL